jgi:hypothetical protein
MCGEIVKPWLRGNGCGGRGCLKVKPYIVTAPADGARRALSLVIRDAFVQKH